MYYLQNKSLLVQKILPAYEQFQLQQCLWLQGFSAIQFLNKVCKNPEDLEPDQPQTQMYYIENRILLNSPENPPSMWIVKHSSACIVSSFKASQSSSFRLACAKNPNNSEPDMTPPETVCITYKIGAY